MKTAEQRAADRHAVELARLTGGMAGRSPQDLRPSEEPVAKQLDWFKPHPANAVFDAAKTARYWRDLERDIREAGRIIDPVIALPDGTLIEGHSRITVARKLAREGVELGRILTVILDLSPEEAERRVLLGNLSRFELDEDTRLALYVRVWSDYYLEAKPGRPRKGDTVSPFSDGTAATRREDIAAATGKSVRQVARDRAVIREATERARSEGRPAPEVEDIHAARVNAAGRRKDKALRPVASLLHAHGIVVEVTAADLAEIIAALSAEPSRKREKIIEKLTAAERAFQGHVP